MGKITGFHKYYIRGVLVSKSLFVRELESNGGEVFTFAPCSPNNTSHRIWTDGKDVYRE